MHNERLDLSLILRSIESHDQIKLGITLLACVKTLLLLLFFYTLKDMTYSVRVNNTYRFGKG